MWYNAPFNAEIIKFIQSFSNPFLDNLFQAITMMGEEYFFVIALTLIYWCVDKKFGYKLGFAILGSTALNAGIKEVFKVPRPIGEPGIRSLRVQTATGYSFPSGHTQGASTFWISLMLHVKKRFLYILGIVLILLVGISRLYLGVHRPVDVICGLLLALVWVLASNKMFDYAERSGRKQIFLAFIIPAVLVMFFIKNADYYKAVGMLLGFYAGYIIEPVYIGFDVKATLVQNILKMIIGVGGILIVRVLLKMVLPSSIISDFIRYMLMGLWATIAAPYIFKKAFNR